MLARVRISLPDRPGGLGLITSAIGAAAANIVKIDVLESESGRALDDVFVTVRDPTHLAVVGARLQAVQGLNVMGVQHPAPPVTGHADLELLGQVLSRPERGLQTMVDGAPHAFGADWAVVVEYDPGGMFGKVLMTSPSCPGPDHVVLTGPLRLASIQIRPPGATEPYGGSALVPVGSGPIGLVLVRTEGPQFHGSELWRVGMVGQIIGTVLIHV